VFRIHGFSSIFQIEDLRKITCTSSTKPIILIDEYSLCKKWKIDYFYFVIIMGFVLFICFLSVYFNLHEIFWSYVRNNRWNSCNRTVSTETCSYRRNSSEVYMQRIQYDELAVATENWDQNRVLGRGGFGVVYKGNWRHTDVAIKRLKSEVSYTK
jgi:interleukin-1 receptor-associated kinase 1